MTSPAQITILPSATLSQRQHAAIQALCSRAYEEDFSGILALFDAPTHVVATVDDQVVSHALWVTRLLDYNGTMLRSAYVEAVATEPRYQGRGYASAVLKALAQAIETYDIGALSPSDPAFYARLGWEVWQGSLYVIQGAHKYETPDEEVMVLRLPHTPPLDLKGTLAAPWRVGDIW